jgi:hypothetical protein
MGIGEVAERYQCAHVACSLRRTRDMLTTARCNSTGPRRNSSNIIAIILVIVIMPQWICDFLSFAAMTILGAAFRFPLRQTTQYSPPSASRAAPCTSVPLQSRRRCGSVPAQMWLRFNADVGTPSVDVWLQVGMDSASAQRCAVLRADKPGMEEQSSVYH